VGEEAFLKIGPLKKPVGLDPAMLERCRDRFRFVDGDTEIAPGIHLLTRLRGTFAPPAGNRLLWRRTDHGLARDDFGHELMLVVDDPDGLALFTSCSHNGILNMIAAAQARFPGRPIKALVGGFHFVGLPIANLFGDDGAAIRAIAEGLRESGIARILTTHCTGKAGYERLREVLGSAIEYAGAGATYEV
jgi:7,8-dihydropterin-6-yl-methyl-4-(beta-D-ribofuranosyl)aminobenzene 5'-phosphate synthase